MDLTSRFFFSVRAIICGLECLFRRSCRSRMVLCIPLVLRVRAVIEGWKYGWVGGGVLGCGVFFAEVGRDVCVCHWVVGWVVWGVEDSVQVCLGVESVSQGRGRKWAEVGVWVFMPCILGC